VVLKHQKSNQSITKHFCLIPTISTKQSSISNHLSLNAKKNAIYGIINQDLGLEQAHKCGGVKSCDG
jgi:hypothetical protein